LWRVLGLGRYIPLAYRRERNRREILRNSGDSDKTGGTGRGPSGAGETIHRRPLTAGGLARLFEAALADRAESTP